MNLDTQRIWWWLNKAWRVNIALIILGTPYLMLEIGSTVGIVPAWRSLAAFLFLIIAAPLGIRYAYRQSGICFEHWWKFKYPEIGP